MSQKKNALAAYLTRVAEDARRMGYSDKQVKAIVREEADRYSTYDVARAADATRRRK